MRSRYIFCPYCLCQDYKQVDGKYECSECKSLFSEDDIKREAWRHLLSCFFSENNATESNPMKIDALIGENDAIGLSSLELPRVVSGFEFEDGTIWFNIEGMDEPVDFDDMNLVDLGNIVDTMIENDKK